MLLTIHNLPSSISYADLKTLIYNKCGLTDTILDHLVNEGSTKKVTIGVADEGDAAILVRKINGLFLDGQHLYVADVRKQRGTEQPYRSTSNSNNQRPYYQTVPGYDSMSEKQSMNIMIQQPTVENCNMTERNCYAPKQNFASMDYGNQNQSLPPKQTEYSNQEQAYGYETKRVEDIYKIRNSRRDNQRGRSPQRPQGYDQDLPKSSRWVVGNPVRENEIPKRESWIERDRDQQNAFRPPVDNYLDQQNSFRPSNDNYRDRQNSFRPSNNNYRDQSNAFAPSNNDFGRQDSYHASNNDYRGQGSAQEMVGNIEQQLSYNVDGSSRNKDRDFNHLDENSYGSNIYGNHVTETQIRASASSRWEKKEEPQKKHFVSSNKLDFCGPQSYSSSKNDNERFRSPSSFAKDPRGIDFSRNRSGFASDRLDNTNVKSFGGSVSNRKSFENRSRQPAFAMSRSERNTFQQFESKPIERESRKRSYNANDRDIGFPKKKFEPNTRGVEFLKFNQNEPKINKDQDRDIIKTINKDQTWRGQAASKIANQMLQKFSREKRNPRLLLQLKLSIRTRIDVLLGEKLLVPYEEIIELYRKKFGYKNDRTFYHAVEEIVQNTKIEQKKPRESTTNENVIDKDTKPNKLKKEETVTNVSKEPSNEAATQKPQSTKGPTKQPSAEILLKNLDLTLNPNLSGKALGKAQKKIAKLEYQDEQVYTLPSALKVALDTEMDALIDIFKKECSNPETEAHKRVCEKITQLGVHDFRKVVSLNVTKRVLNIRTGLALRVMGNPKPPKKASLLEFLSHYGGVAVNKSERKKIYIATVDSYEKYDELCSLGSVLIDDISVQFSPIHITGPPQKITRAEILQKRNQWIQNQIDKNIENENKDNGQSNSNIAQDQNVDNSEPELKTDNKKHGDTAEINIKNVDQINEECILVEDEEAKDVVDLDTEDEIGTAADETKVEELLEAELNENDFEDY